MQLLKQILAVCATVLRSSTVIHRLSVSSRSIEVTVDCCFLRSNFRICCRNTAAHHSNRYRTIFFSVKDHFTACRRISNTSFCTFLVFLRGSSRPLLYRPAYVCTIFCTSFLFLRDSTHGSLRAGMCYFRISDGNRFSVFYHSIEVPRLLLS
jgi:hypothetical protein